jgi:hypothetical protein
VRHVREARFVFGIDNPASFSLEKRLVAGNALMEGRSDADDDGRPREGSGEEQIHFACVIPAGAAPFLLGYSIFATDLGEPPCR